MNSTWANSNKDLTIEDLNKAISLINTLKNPLEQYMLDRGCDPSTGGKIVFSIEDKDQMLEYFKYGIPDYMAFSKLIEKDNFILCNTPKFPSTLTYIPFDWNSFDELYNNEHKDESNKEKA